MSGDVSVSFLISVVLGDIVQVVSSDNNSPLHLGRDDDSFKNLTSNTHSTSKRAFLIDVVRFDGFLGSLEVKTNILIVSDT